MNLKFLKIENLYASKNKINKEKKRQPIEWKKVVENCIYLIRNVYAEHTKDS